MTRYERKIYSFGVVIAAILIIAIVAVLTEGCGAETAVYAAPMVNVEDFTEVATEAPKKAEIREQEASDEPETEEQDRCDKIGTDHEEDRTDTESELRTTEASVEADLPVLYRIAGEEIQEELQIKLYQYLSDAGIDYWYTGALAQMFQESHCHQYAENPNGLDKGIYQYRITYWNWNDGDIFDVDAQLQRYASEMSARFNAGLSVDEAISRHKTSDYCTAVDWTYVGHVKQWLGQMEAIK